MAALGQEFGDSELRFGIVASLATGRFHQSRGHSRTWWPTASESRRTTGLEVVRPAVLGP